MFTEQMAASKPLPSGGKINGKECKLMTRPFRLPKSSEGTISHPVEAHTTAGQQLDENSTLGLHRACSLQSSSRNSQPRAASQAELRGFGAGMGDRIR